MIVKLPIVQLKLLGNVEFNHLTIFLTMILLLMGTSFDNIIS